MLRSKAFTLIELLIVVAIIAILAAIAVPNFLEAQTRSKVARSKADERTIDTAMQSYIVDWNNEPKVNVVTPRTGIYSEWWGFVSPSLTTPVAYIARIPTMIFYDTNNVYTHWVALAGSTASKGNQPYTVIRDTSLPVRLWPPNAIVNASAPAGMTAPTKVPPYFIDSCKTSGYLIYCAGPDNIDATAYGFPEIYDPTNGTVSFGDIYRFGVGSADDDDAIH